MWREALKRTVEIVVTPDEFRFRCRMRWIAIDRTLPHKLSLKLHDLARQERDRHELEVLKAQKRVWIASPYFVPDAGLRDALRLAGYLGVDVRLLCQYRPDKWLPQYAAQYYWAEMLQAGVKVYQYTRGMMHSKVFLVDDEWASVGTANLDNRSLHLNFEVNCLMYSRQAVAELEEAFLRDLSTAIRLDRAVYPKRPVSCRLLENACRLLSPVL